MVLCGTSVRALSVPPIYRCLEQSFIHTISVTLMLCLQKLGGKLDMQIVILWSSYEVFAMSI